MFKPAVIKKIAYEDSEVGQITKPALALLNSSLEEMFKTILQTSLQSSPATIGTQEIAQSLQSIPSLDFLTEVQITHVTKRKKSVKGSSNVKKLKVEMEEKKEDEVSEDDDYDE